LFFVQLRIAVRHRTAQGMLRPLNPPAWAGKSARICPPMAGIGRRPGKGSPSDDRETDGRRPVADGPPKVAQIFNLLYRSFASCTGQRHFRRAPEHPTRCRLQIGDTAGWKPCRCPSTLAPSRSGPATDVRIRPGKIAHWLRPAARYVPRRRPTPPPVMAKITILPANVSSRSRRWRKPHRGRRERPAWRWEAGCFNCSCGTCRGRGGQRDGQPLPARGRRGLDVLNQWNKDPEKFRLTCCPTRSWRARWCCGRGIDRGKFTEMECFPVLNPNLPHHDLDPSLFLRSASRSKQHE
jgi:hypothetical protein